MPTIPALPPLTPDQQSRADAWRKFFIAQEDALSVYPEAYYDAKFTELDAMDKECDAAAEFDYMGAKKVLEEAGNAEGLAEVIKLENKALEQRVALAEWRAHYEQEKDEQEQLASKNNREVWFANWQDSLPALLEAAAELRPTSADTQPLLSVTFDYADGSESEGRGYPALAWRTLMALPEIEQPEAVIPALLSLLLKASQSDQNHDLTNHDLHRIAQVAACRHWPILEAWLKQNADWQSDNWLLAVLDGLEDAAKSDAALAPVIAGHAAGHLARHADNHPLNNAFLAVILIAADKERRHAPLIKEAFAADHINENMCGDWNDIYGQLGLPESEQDAIPRRAHWWEWMHVHMPARGPAREIAPAMRREYERRRNALRAETTMRAKGAGHPVYKKRK